jgi:hypothetical protein
VAEQEVPWWLPAREGARADPAKDLEVASERRMGVSQTPILPDIDQRFTNGVSCDATVVQL